MSSLLFEIEKGIYWPGVVDQFKVHTIVVANVSGDKNRCRREKLPYGGPVVNVREQSRHRYLSSHQLEACDSGSEHDEHDGQGDRYSRRVSQ
jgi:hypothetical protein